jgi:hypothetical protein
MRNPESRDAQEETTDMPWRKKGNKGGRRSLFLRKEWTTMIDIRGWSSGQQLHLESGGTLYTTLRKTLYEINGMKIVKQKPDLTPHRIGPL